MRKSRLEAFSDGVVAIIITIMVLELKVPEHGKDGPKDLLPMLPFFLSYILSFINVGIYWNNHHHMFYLVDSITGGALWANLNLLFWLSLIPFSTEWMAQNDFSTWPVAVYGVNLILCGVAYTILSRILASHCAKNSELAEAIGRDWKGKASIVIYAAAIALAFWHPWIAGLLYVVVACMWFIPDRRIEQRVRATPHGKE
ncbi:MAG TPA: TMEM175 family protein [Mucilaginibacter sp.]|nr:TMEM175 family protein [Mucilaginibacter sp.]